MASPQLVYGGVVVAGGAVLSVEALVLEVSPLLAWQIGTIVGLGAATVVLDIARRR